MAKSIFLIQLMGWDDAFGWKMNPQTRVEYPLAKSVQNYDPSALNSGNSVRAATTGNSCVDDIAGLPWHSIRIAARYIDFDTDIDPFSAEYLFIKNELMPQVISFFQKAMKVRSVAGPMIITPPCKTYSVASDGTRTCIETTARCSIINDQVINIPNEVLVGSAGIEADYVILLTAKNDPVCSQGIGNSGALAFALSCQTDQCDRPIIGSANICPQAIDTSTDYSRTSLTSTVIHELMHALGFNTDLVPFFRYTNGIPRVARDTTNGLPPYARYTCSTDGEHVSASWTSRGSYIYFFPQGLITNVNRRGLNDCKCPFTSPQDGESLSNSDLSNCLNYSNCVIELQTPKVVAAAQSYYGCPESTGAELESNQEFDCSILSSHWSFRNTNTEIMTPVSSTSISFISPMTMAFFEDSGWYQMDYTMGTTLVRGAFWGYEAGCQFIENKCINSATGDVVSSASHEREFCSAQDAAERVYKCSPSAMLKTFCIPSDSSNVPAWFNYGIGNNGGDVWSQYCPYFAVQSDGDCFTPTSNLNTAIQNSGENAGTSSRCLESSFGGYTNLWGVCYSVECTSGGAEYYVSVASAGGIRKLTSACTQFGQQISDDLNEFPGVIKCADPVVICSGYSFPHLNPADLGQVVGALPPGSAPEIPVIATPIPDATPSSGPGPGSAKSSIRGQVVIGFAMSILMIVF